MNWKKILSGVLTAAFIFGVSINTNAASLNDVKDAKQTYDKAKEKVDKVKDGKTFDKDNNKPPEPPKDSNGNTMPPPDKNSDKSKSELDKTKDKYDNAKKVYNRFKNATR